MTGLHKWCRVTVCGPGGEAIACYVLQGAGPPCMATVGTLCRLTLVTRRAGGDVVFDELAPRLRELIELAGVGARVPLDD
jgi:hypothetical protein